MPAGIADTWRKAALVCGIASSVLYGGMIGLIRYDGYSLLSQVPSELTAIGAPTRSLWATLGAFYTLLIIAFGFGIWRGASYSNRIHRVGLLIFLHGLLGLLWPFGPMHQREVLAAGGGNAGDTIHVALSAVTVTLMFVTMAFAMMAFGRRFLVYTVASIVVLVAFGLLTFSEAPRLSQNLPTPWIGLYERINIAVFLIWLVVLALALWPRRSDPQAL